MFSPECLVTQAFWGELNKYRPNREIGLRRIEEYYRFKKTGFKFEKFLVRSLASIRNLDLLLSMAIGYIGILSEKAEESIEVLEIIEASQRLYGLAQFMFYAISDGLKEIFSKLYTGVRSFFRLRPPSLQMCIVGWRWE